MKLTPGAVAILERQRIALKEQRLALGHDFPTAGGVQDLVFRSATGGATSESALNEALKRIGEAIGVPGLHLHDLRHSCASLLLANDVPMKQIQEWLGHSDISTTSNIYAHLDYSSKVLSASTMEGALKLPELNLTKSWD